MSQFEGMLTALKTFASAVLDSCAFLVVIGATALAGLTTGIGYVFGLLVAASIPAPPPPGALPSFHCLMHLAHCIP